MNPLVLIPISLVFAVGMILGRNELAKRKLVCPETGTVADVDVVQRFCHPEKPVRVRACSLLPGAKRIDCHQGCLKRCA